MRNEAMQNGAVQNGKGRFAIIPGLLLLLFFAPTIAQTRPAGQNSNQEHASAPVATDRQKAMQADMDRLLQLARHLKNEVDSSRKDELSMKVIRDADEIDKLARSARARIH